jgi:hypothetical protein
MFDGKTSDREDASAAWLQEKTSAVSQGTFQLLEGEIDPIPYVLRWPGHTEYNHVLAINAARLATGPPPRHSGLAARGDQEEGVLDYA